jgi:hypothetical protein
LQLFFYADNEVKSFSNANKLLPPKEYISQEYYEIAKHAGTDFPGKILTNTAKNLTARQFWQELSSDEKALKNIFFIH